jgi:hypothetical protein
MEKVTSFSTYPESIESESSDPLSSQLLKSVLKNGLEKVQEAFKRYKTSVQMAALTGILAFSLSGCGDNNTESSYVPAAAATQTIYESSDMCSPLEVKPNTTFSKNGRYIKVLDWFINSSNYFQLSVIDETNKGKYNTKILDNQPILDKNTNGYGNIFSIGVPNTNSKLRIIYSDTKINPYSYQESGDCFKKLVLMNQNGEKTLSSNPNNYSITK